MASRAETTKPRPAAARRPSTKAPTRAASARAPQDRKPRADRKPPELKAKAVGLSGDEYEVTCAGVTVVIGVDVLNDFELIEELSTGGDVAMPSVLRRLVGDAYDEVKDACRDDNGRVVLAGPGSVTEWIVTVLGAINPS